MPAPRRPSGPAVLAVIQPGFSMSGRRTAAPGLRSESAPTAATVEASTEQPEEKDDDGHDEQQVNQLAHAGDGEPEKPTDDQEHDQQFNQTHDSTSQGW